MIYAIKRETLIPWDGSKFEIHLDGSIYDIVESPKNTGLETVADFVIENNTVIKTRGNESIFVEAYEAKTNTKLSELILG